MIGSDPRSPARMTSAAGEEEWRLKPQERNQTLKRDESDKAGSLGQEASHDRQTLKGTKTEERRPSGPAAAFGDTSALRDST